MPTVHRSFLRTTDKQLTGRIQIEPDTTDEVSSRKYVALLSQSETGYARAAVIKWARRSDEGSVKVVPPSSHAHLPACMCSTVEEERITYTYTLSSTHFGGIMTWFARVYGAAPSRECLAYLNATQRIWGSRLPERNQRQVAAMPTVIRSIGFRKFKTNPTIYSIVSRGTRNGDRRSTPTFDITPSRINSIISYRLRHRPFSQDTHTKNFSQVSSQCECMLYIA